MPVNCTQCGAALERGQRFCANCGAPVASYPSHPERQSAANAAYPRTGPNPAQVRRPAASAGQQPRPRAKASPAAQNKSDRGLNIALMICGILAIAVLTFVLILLLHKDEPADGQIQPSPTPIQTNAGQGNTGFQPAVTTPVPGSSAVTTPQPTTAPAIQPGVIPTQPTAAPAQYGTGTSLPGTGTAVPTTAPVAVITPTPRPTTAPAPSSGGGAVSVSTPTPAPSTDYLLPDSNSRYLSNADLTGLTHEQLCFARNEIYARHGRIFKTPQVSNYFKTKSWYKGTVSPESFNEGVFNEYERANIQLIKNYENKYYGGSYY